MKINFKNWIGFLVVILLFTACTPSPSKSPENMVEDMPSAVPTDSLEVVASPSVQEPAATLTMEPSFEIVPSPVLTQIEMLDEQNGWGQAEEMVLRTEDGGETWLNVTSDKMYNDPAYAKSFFLGASVAWILIEDVDGPMVGTLFHTTDGGQTWNWRNTPFGRSDFGFLDVEYGYALTDLGAAVGSMGVAIWETKNSGGDWDRTFVHQPGLDDSLPLSGIKNGISFHDPLNGWVAGSIPQDGFIWLYRTRDGGFSWEHQELTMPELYEEAQISVDAPLFFDGGLGLLPVKLYIEELATVFYRTTDKGETWTATLPLPTSGKLAIASIDEIVVWDGSTSVFSTLDGGETWSFHASDWHPEDTLRKLDFVSATHGWALTESSLYRTDDGGKTWGKLGE